MSRELRIIGIPLDLGQSKRGVDMGPAAIRYAGLAAALSALGHLVQDGGNLPVAVRETVSAEAGEHFLPSIVDACTMTYHAAREAMTSGATPIFLGGDHSLAIGSYGGVTEERSSGLLWFDAHADFNTPESSPTGNIHGMPLAVLLGDGYPELVGIGRPGPKARPEDVVLIGVRELDSGERTRLQEKGLAVYTMRDIDERGIGAVVREALERLERHRRVHVSFDLDCLDPQSVPGVGTTVPGGLTCREAHLAMELIADCGCCASLDLVEINPILDRHNKSALFAVGLAASLFGKRIL